MRCVVVIDLTSIVYRALFDQTLTKKKNERANERKSGRDDPYFAGGHRCAFDGLHFACAFTGFTQFNFYVMGALLAANTWSGDVAACASLPAAAAAMIRIPHRRSRSKSEETIRFPVAFRASLARLALGYSLLRAVGARVGRLSVSVHSHTL